MASCMLCAVERPAAELSILLLDDASMQRMNRQYRGLDRPTDVLSFAMLEGDFAGVQPQLLGDVVISIPTAVRQAKRARRTIEREIATLLAHGILHLLGFDHHLRRAAVEMARQTKVLVEAALGSSSGPAVGRNPSGGPSRGPGRRRPGIGTRCSSARRPR